MKIEILPDPQKPLGGSAVLRLDGASGLPDAVTLAVYDRTRERWLADQTWQGVPVRFGPYPVTQTADGAASITVGSEIVDHIDEYTPLTLQIGETSVDADWPDTIMVAPGSPPLGRILSPDETMASLSGTRQAPPRPSPVAPKRDPKPEVPPEPIEEETDEDEEVDRKPSKLPLILGALAVAALVAGGAYYVLSQDGGDPVSLCTTAALDATPAADTLDRLAQCRSEIDAQTAFRLVERGYRAGDSGATFAMGQLYDGAMQHPLLEGRFALGYPENLANAARYYAKAREAGTEEAAAALAAVCQRAEESTDALVRENVGVYCP